MSSAAKQDILSNELPDATNLLLGRLDNWNHAVQIFQDFVESHLSTQKSITSGLEKSRKVVSEAPKFDFATPGSSSAVATSPVTGTAPGGAAGGAQIGDQTPQEPSELGIAEAFQDLRTRIEGLLNKSLETENQLKSAVIPQLTTLRGDIEKHSKGLKGPGLKGQKEVEKSRQLTQKHIETLGQYTSSAVAGNKIDPKCDPFVLHRLVKNSANDQINKENIQADVLLSMQKNFLTLERHIVQVLQQASHVLEETIDGYSASVQEALTSVSGSFGHIHPDHEWNSFVQNHSNTLVKDDQKRSLSDITFANDEHQATKPLMEGLLHRKGTIMKNYQSGYFVLTSSKFLHQFKSQDFVQDPTPELSLYMPDCTLGPASTQESGKFKFQISGKEAGKTLAKKHTYTFKTNTYAEMSAWHEALLRASGVATTSKLSPENSPEVMSPVSGTAPTPVGAGEGVADAATAEAVGVHPTEEGTAVSQPAYAEPTRDPALAAAAAATGNYMGTYDATQGETHYAQPAVSVATGKTSTASLPPSSELDKTIV